MQVVFAVADLARSLDFYERAFGWPRNEWIDEVVTTWTTYRKPLTEEATS